MKRHLFLTLLALATVLPQQSYASPLGGASYSGDTTNAATYDFGGTQSAIRYDVLKLSVEWDETRPSYDPLYVFTVSANFDAYFTLLYLPPDLDAPADYFLADVADNEEFEFYNNTEYYLLIRGAENAEFGAYTFGVVGDVAATITRISSDDPAAVPEPATSALVAAAIGGILYRQRKRRA